MNTPSGFQDLFDPLRRFAPKTISQEHCDLCSLRLGEVHQHLLEVPRREIICACEACAVLFTDGAHSRFKRIPRRARRLEDFQLSDIDWESLAIPIGLAFFFRASGNSNRDLSAVALPHGRASDTNVVAFYPSPAGATESLLDLSAWSDLTGRNPVLNEMQPDVEALLVNRISKKHDHYLAPIDECYRLVGLIRLNWRGLSGGKEVWTKIGQFFQELERRS
ncbi:MAG: hypothetical protein C5B46_02255 [Proteobacteria bacterium]|nr:MAG: hypothetical protein C5B46_02255 [Pseudomonadota bacterium]